MGKILHRGASLKKRLKLFDATVGSCLLWCAESWTLRQEDAQALKSAQNKMLRSITGIRRRPDEEYVSWIQRATRKARSLASAHGVRFWDVTYGRLQWRWAGHVARRAPSEWVWKVTFWRDGEWTSLMKRYIDRPLRARPGRWSRWEDAVIKKAASMEWPIWRIAAENRQEWRDAADQLVF